HVDMTTLAGECWSRLASARGEREIDFVLAQLPPAEGDRELIQKVWMNVLDNAIKYTARRDDARVDVSATAQAGMVTYVVSDNGAGFDMRYADKLGQVFQRLHPSEDYAGTG